MSEATVQATIADKIVNGTFCEREESGASHVYRDDKGIRVPSATQVLAFIGLVDFSRVKPEVLERKRQIGTAVHAACEYIDGPNGDELDWDTVDPSALPYILAYENFCKTVKFVSHSVEQAGIGCSYGMKYGYRIDRIGEIEGYPAIVEIKCGYKEECSWPLQLAGYELSAPKLDPAKTRLKKYLRVAAQLKKDGRFKVCGPYDKATDSRHFLSAVSLSWFKINSKFSIPNVPDEIGEEEDDE